MYKVQRNKKIISISVFVLLLVCIFIFSIYHNQHKKQETTYDRHDKCTATYYRVLDKYGLPGYESFMSIMKRENIKECLTEMKTKLSNAQNFKYLEVYDYLIQIKGNYSNGKQFIDGYEYLAENELSQFINQEVQLEDGKTLLTNVKGIFIGNETFHKDLVLDHVMKGKSFSNEDFVCRDNVIHVILGYDYLELYEIGDEIPVLYLGDPFTLKVIGFLEQDIFYQIESKKNTLNSYIILPSFQIKEESNISSITKKIHLYNTTTGYIKINDGVSIENALDEFDLMVSEIGLVYDHVDME